MEPLLTIEEAAQLLKIKPATIYTWAYRGKIPSQKVGRSLRFRRSALEAWLKAQERPVSLGGGL